MVEAGEQTMALPHYGGGMVTPGQSGRWPYIRVRYGGGEVVGRTFQMSLWVAGIGFSGVPHWVWGRKVQLWVSGEDLVRQGSTISPGPALGQGRAPGWMTRCWRSCLILHDNVPQLSGCSWLIPRPSLCEYLLLILRSLFIHLLIYFFIPSLTDYLRVLCVQVLC